MFIFQICSFRTVYIYQTNAHERLIIQRALDAAFDNLDKTLYLLSEVQDAYFGDAEQKPITATDAEGIAVKLDIACNIIFDAILNYSLTVGRGDFRGVAPYLESAERAALAVKVEQQFRAVFPGIERAERRIEIMQLPDEQATAILEKEGAEA